MFEHCTIITIYYILEESFAVYPSYTLMSDCWNDNPEGRPFFSALQSKISERLESIAGYLDFSPTSTASSDQAQRSCYDNLQTTHLRHHLMPAIIISDENSLPN